MKNNKIKHTIYRRIFSDLFATYLVLMIGFSIVLISQAKKEARLELQASALMMNNIIEGILKDNMDRENNITNMGKVRKALAGEAFILKYEETEMALFTGDYNIIFNTNDYWKCDYTERREGNKSYTSYGYLNPKKWFDEEEIKELENYLYAHPKATKKGELSGYSVSIDGLWGDVEMIIPNEIIVRPMYATRFDENGDINSSSSGENSNDIVYISYGAKKSNEGVVFWFEFS